MSDDKKCLSDEDLKEVTGGGAIPEGCLYTARLIEGVYVKSQPDIKSANVCVAPTNTILYVLEENCGNGFVYCVFKGDRHREWGYIRTEHFVII